jgi:NitT/TauT family transport system substrate-binding protein
VGERRLGQQRYDDPIIAASVGLNPVKDVNWIFDSTRDSRDLFAAGEIDAFIALPPWAQEQCP